MVNKMDYDLIQFQKLKEIEILFKNMNQEQALGFYRSSKNGYKQKHSINHRHTQSYDNETVKYPRVVKQICNKFNRDEYRPSSQKKIQLTSGSSNNLMAKMRPSTPVCPMRFKTESQQEFSMN